MGELNERCVKSFTIGDTLIRLTKTRANLYDYIVSVEDTSTDEQVSVTTPIYIDADQAFGMAFAQAHGEGDDLCALLGVDPDKEGETWTR